MLKRVLKITLIVFSLLLLIYIVIFQLQNYFINQGTENSFLNSGVEDGDFNNYKTIRCNLNILEPKVIFISDLFYENDSALSIFFYNIENSFSKKVEEIRTGGTAIRNTTFPELVKMAKEDCSQFQQSKGDFNEETINWSYSPYTPEPPEVELTEEEKEAERIWHEKMRKQYEEDSKNYKPIEYTIIEE